ncbi:MAG: SRPBCC family protein [Gemmatimonadota bacterium]|nr:SRPBCC family protein [Gemmatimonadota bacterium]
MKITVEATVQAPVQKAWDAYNSPADIVQWNAASPDWHTPRATVDLREGGRFESRMEAKDGSFGFDFGGTYTKIVSLKSIAYRMDDNREAMVDFAEQGTNCVVTVTFDAESENSVEMQREGWQAILDSFARHVIAKG